MKSKFREVGRVRRMQNEGGREGGGVVGQSTGGLTFKGTGKPA